MSEFTVEISEPQTHIIDIETSFVENVNNIEIERYEYYTIDVINNEKILLSDLPDGYPMNKINGDLPVSRISGLAEYLNSYEFDCGTP